MANTIRLRRGSAAPSAGLFVEGEPAWDSSGKKLYVKAADGTMPQVGAPSGSDTQIQFNDSGSFGGDADLTFNKTTNALTVGGDVTLNDGGSFATTLQTITPTANRTISLPDATGTVGLVAGSSGQLTWNSSGAYAGLSTSSVDGSGNVTLSARYIGSVNGASAAPPLSLTGTWFTGGGTTNTKPQLLVEPAGTTSTAWSNSGTGLGVNAASGFVGRLLDLQLNGTSNFSVTSAGATTAAGASTAQRFIPTDSTAPTNGMYLPAVNSVGISSNSTERIRFNSAGLIQFTGTTSSFPAIKQSGATIQIRLADDSGYTTLDAQLRAQGTAPASATATGTAGDIRYDANYIYVCTATNTWKRAALATW